MTTKNDSVTIDSAVKEPQNINALELEITPKGSITISKDKSVEWTTEPVYAVRSYADASGSSTNTLNGAISVMDKSSDPDAAAASHDTCGLLFENTATTGTNYTATIETDNASSIKVTRDTTSKYAVNVFGIAAWGKDDSNTASLVFGSTDAPKFLDGITVSATNSAQTDGGEISAYGISGSSAVTFNAELAAAVKATATSKANSASAYGINGHSDVTISEGITNAISVTSTGTAAVATAINASGASGTLVVGTSATDTADIAGNITSKATANGQNGTAIANGIYGSTITINGNITKNITSTAESTASDGGNAEAYGFQGKNITIEGQLAAAIKISATSKNGKTWANAVYISDDDEGTVNLKGGVTKDITTTASGTEATAVAFATGKSLTIGTKDKSADLAGNITVKATATNGVAQSAANAESDVTVYGNVTGNITSTATVNGDDSDENSVGYGLFGVTLTIKGKVAGTVKVTSTNKSGSAGANGVGGYKTVEIDGGITKDITTSAQGKFSLSYAVLSKQSVTIGTGSASADIAGKLTATATSNGTEKKDTASSAAIYCYDDLSQVEDYILTINGDVTNSLTATASAVGGIAEAYGIQSGTVQIIGALSGAVKATATGKMNAAEAYGIAAKMTTEGTVISHNLTITEGITKDITATASGSATASAATTTTATAINASGALTITGEDVTVKGKTTKTAIGGAITASATGKSVLSADTEAGAYTGDAEAIGIGGSTVTLNGDVTKAITATATANSEKMNTGIAVSGTATTYGILSTDALSITGAVAGAVKATATSKANTAMAYGINSDNTVNISKGITKDVTATATGTATASTEEEDIIAMATAINADKGLTVGTVETSADIAGKITATVTGNALLDAAGTNAYAGTAVAYGINSAAAFTVNGSITKDIAATTTANSVKTNTGIAVSDIAAAIGIISTGALSITGTLSGAVKATATAKANYAMAYGIDCDSMTINDSITKDIAATAAGMSADAVAIGVSNGLTVGTVETSADISGKIVATATANSALDAAKTTPVEGEASAYGIVGDSVTMNGSITQGVAATATANSVTMADKTAASGTATAYGIHTNTSLSITDALSGAVKATATSKANKAMAYGIASNNTVDLKEGITKDVTATATGAATTSSSEETIATAIDAVGGLTIGTASTTENAIAGKITATATANAALDAAGTIAHAGVAHAYGINSKDALTVNGSITKDVAATATANSVKTNTGIAVSGIAIAYGIRSKGELNITGAVSGAVKATATAKASSLILDDLTVGAYGIYGGNTVTISTGITKDVTATATGSAVTEERGLVSASAIYAYKLLAIGKENITENAIAGKITATAIGNAALDATKATAYESITIASGIHSANGMTVYGSITKDIAAIATANSVTKADKTAVSGGAYAYCINNERDELKIIGAVSGAFKATATAKANCAEAYGVISVGNTSISKGITKDVTASATGAATVGDVTKTTAAAIYVNNSLTIGTDAASNAIAGKLTATATANAAVDAYKTSAYAGNAEAYGINGTKSGSATSEPTMTINGSITKDIVATATANSVTKADKTAVSGTATAYGISSIGALTVNGDIKGKITVNATSKASTAQAFGIYSSTAVLTVNSSLGTINATATGNGGEACGVSAKGIVYKKDVLTGNITVTCKTGSATGIQTAWIRDAKDKAGTATLTVTATGQKAIGLLLSGPIGTGELTLSASKITAKTTDNEAGEAKAISSTSDTNQNIALTNKSVLSGDVALLGMGDDTLTLNGQSTITGDVDLGEDDDAINIYTGSQIKGDVANVEKCTFTFDTLKYASTALWEGEEFSCKESQGMSIKFIDDVIDELKVGKKKTLTLLQDTDGNVWGSEGTETINLNIGGATGVTCVGADITLGGCKLNIHIDDKGKQLLCDVIKLA